MTNNFAENFLYHIWDEQHLTNQLFTSNKEKIKILFQGKWNTHKGPDFRNAIIIINNNKIQGDVEIHRLESDWKQHKHHENKNFNDVILHVVYANNTSNKYTISESGKRIPIFILKDQLDEQIEKLWQKYGEKSFDKLQKQSIICQLKEKLQKKEELMNLLYELGIKRFEKKCKRFSAELYDSDFNQILYKGILEALGYDKNKNSFLKLSSILTYKKLQGFSSFCKDYKDLFFILITYGNLKINNYNYDFLKKLNKHRYNFIKKEIVKKHFSNSMEIIDWNFFRLRPQNHPLNRLWQIAPFLYFSLDRNLMNIINTIFSIEQKTKYQPNYFKNNFFKIINYNNTAKNKLGKPRCNDVFVNIILPVCFVYAETLNYTKLRQTIHDIYVNLSKLSENYITKFMRSNLEFSPRYLRKIKLVHQQGMLQLYYQYCAHHECNNCINNLSPIIK